MKSTVLLGVNIDHIATLRQARGTMYPDPIQGALIAIENGADSITLHLREDRRHIQDQDVYALKKVLKKPINLEMAATEEMVNIACNVKPNYCCLVPEKRHELTTEGGLDVVSQQDYLTNVCAQLKKAGIVVSLFIDPLEAQITAAKKCGAPVIELHTGEYANATEKKEIDCELMRLKHAAQFAHQLGLTVNAGHGLHFDNVKPIAAIPHMHELNIGHSLIADAVFMGLGEAVKQMKKLLL